MKKETIKSIIEIIDSSVTPYPIGKIVEVLKELHKAYENTDTPAGTK